MENKAKIITVAGKGGVGKTSICAIPRSACPSLLVWM